MRIGTQEIQYLNAFQTISHASARDCLIGNTLVSFLVKEGQMGLTIGKKGITIKKLQQALKKKIEVFEHKETAEAFLQNAFPQVAFEKIGTEKQEEKKVLVIKMDGENKRKLLSDTGKLKRIKELAKRNYEIDDFQIGNREW
jgi:N utilization substance protein A